MVAVASTGAVPVSGEQLSVSGKQKLLKGSEDTYRMIGGMVGKWKITSFKTIAVKPVFKGKGTESFDGCIDVKRDGSCSGDPSGTLKFKFRYWARLNSHGDKVLLGTCSHPVTGGNGDFAGASGFLMMVDTPIKKPPFTVTHYEGTITIARLLVMAASERRSSPPPRC